MKKINKKGQVFDQMSALGIGIAALVITLVVVFLILAQVKANASVVADGNASTAVQVLTTSAATIPNWVSIVVITAIGALLIGMAAMFRR